MRSTKKYIPALCLFLGASCMAIPAFAQAQTQDVQPLEKAQAAESAEMPVWVNDTLNAEIMMLEKKKNIVQLRSEIKKLEYEMEDIEAERNRPQQPEMAGPPGGPMQGMPGQQGMPGGFPPQGPNFGGPGGMMGQQGMPEPEPRPEPMPEPEPKPEPKQVVKKEEPEKRVELPSIMRIAGQKGSLLAVLVYEQGGGTCTVEKGDVLPKGGKVVKVSSRGVTVVTDKDTQKTLMFSREFSGRATGITASAQNNGMAPPVMAPMPPLDDPYDSADMGADGGMSLY
jgi:type IV pilus biogenesis protein PilP